MRRTTFAGREREMPTKGKIFRIPDGVFSGEFLSWKKRDAGEGIARAQWYSTAPNQCLN